MLAGIENFFVSVISSFKKLDFYNVLYQFVINILENTFAGVGGFEGFLLVLYFLLILLLLLFLVIRVSRLCQQITLFEKRENAWFEYLSSSQDANHNILMQLLEESRKQRQQVILRNPGFYKAGSSKE